MLCRWVCGYSMFVGSGHGSWRSNGLHLGLNQRRLSGAQPRGVTTPKKQSPLFACTTWFGSTGMMTTPAEARAAAHATTTAMESCIFSFLLLWKCDCRSGPRRANKGKGGRGLCGSESLVVDLKIGDGRSTVDERTGRPVFRTGVRSVG